jgi:hypothetical protein
MEDKDEQLTPAELPPVTEVDAIVKEFAEDMRRELAARKEGAVKAIQTRNRLRLALVEEEERVQALMSGAGENRRKHAIVRTAEDHARRASLEAELAKAELEADAERQRLLEFEQRLRTATAERLSLISR